jgi:hypothetical protein
LLGRTFLLLTHVGRKAGHPHDTVAVSVAFRREHPRWLHLLSAVLGWGDLTSDATLRDFVRSHPFVALRPAHQASIEER